MSANVPNHADLVIWGTTLRGRPFRPSDWAERLAGVVSVFGGEKRLEYSPLLLPVMVEGTRAVVVGGELAQLEPRLFAFLLGFARDNELRHVWVAGALAAPHVLSPPPPAHGEDGPASGPREPV